MLRSKTVKRALIMSIVSMLLCCSMLVGTTYAYFAERIDSGPVKIVGGVLDIELYKKDENDGNEFKRIDKTTEDLFKINWEPNAKKMVTLRVANEGNMVFDYELGLWVDHYTSNPDLAKNIYVYLYLGTDEPTEFDKDDNASWKQLSTLYEDFVPLTGRERLLPKDDEKGNPGYKDVTVVLYMPEGASDALQGKSVDLKVYVKATQPDADLNTPDMESGNAVQAIGVRDAAALPAALETVGENGTGTLILENDVTVDNALLLPPAGSNIVLDLNGHTMKVVSDWKDDNYSQGLHLTTGGTMTFVNGTLTGCTNNAYAPVIAVENGATLNLENVTLRLEDSDVDRQVLLYVETGSTVNLKEGADVVLDSNTRSEGFYLYGSNAALNMTGGSIQLHQKAAEESYAVTLTNGAVFNLLEGEIAADGANVTAVEVADNAVFNMVGGEISVTGAGSANAVKIVRYAVVTMTGGGIQVGTQSGGFGIGYDAYAAMDYFDRVVLRLSDTASIQAETPNTDIAAALKDKFRDGNYPNISDQRADP